MRSIALRVGIIALIAGGAFVLRPFLSSNAGSLAAGDCFDPPTDASTTVEDVQHHPCTDPHGAEVVFVGDFEPATDTYPTDDEVEAFVGTRCVPAFNSYTGLNYDEAMDLSLDWYWPTEEGWDDGSKKVICFVIRADGATQARSIKAQ
jgi:hypothetical protein